MDMMWHEAGTMNTSLIVTVFDVPRRIIHCNESLCKPGCLLRGAASHWLHFQFDEHLNVITNQSRRMGSTRKGRCRQASGRVPPAVDARTETNWYHGYQAIGSPATMWAFGRPRWWREGARRQLGKHCKPKTSAGGATNASRIRDSKTRNELWYSE